MNCVCVCVCVCVCACACVRMHVCVCSVSVHVWMVTAHFLAMGLSSDDEFGEEDLQAEEKQPSLLGATRTRSSSISGGREEAKDRPKGEGSLVLTYCQTVLHGYWSAVGRRGIVVNFWETLIFVEVFITCEDLLHGEAVAYWNNQETSLANT